MASTLAELRGRVQQLGYGTDSATAQNDALNRAQRHVCGMRRWTFLEVTAATFDTVAGTPNYAFADIAGDFLHPDAVGLVDGTQNLELDYVQPSVLRRRERMFAFSGTPDSWTSRGLEIRLCPTPDRVMTAVVDYLKAPTEMAADGNTTILPEQYDDILVWLAVADLAVRQRDYDTRGVAKQEASDLLRAMVDEYGVRQRQNSTEVVRTGEIEWVNRHVPELWRTF